MNILVTGASGFVGRHLVAHLSAEGHQVTALLRKTSTALPEPVKVMRHDGTTEDIARAVAEAKPRLTFHLASLFVAEHHPEQVTPLVDSNVLFGTQVLDGLTRAGCRSVVNVGTIWQNFSGDEYDPVCLYAATKQAFQAMAKYYVSAHGLSITTVKLSDTYGPSDHRGKLWTSLVEAGRSGRTLKLSPGKQLVDLVHVEDVVRALQIAGNRLLEGTDSGQIEYVATSGHPRTLESLVGEVAKHCKPPPQVEWGARPYRQREVMSPWSGGTPVPGWEPQRDLEQGLQSLVKEHAGH